MDSHAAASPPTAHQMRFAERRRAGSARFGPIRAHPTTAFFLLAYGVSWTVLAVLGGWLGAPAALVILTQTLGPTVAAVVVLGATGGRASVGELADRIRIWRVEPRWYLVAVPGIPIACLVAAMVLDAPAVFAASSSASVPATFLVFLVVGWLSGPLFEEPGWRGVALPRLQSMYGPAQATLVLGVLWAGWHLPQFLVPEWAAQNGGSDVYTVGLFFVMVVAISALMTWVFNHTRGSLFLAMLTHSSINGSLAMLPLAPAQALDTGVLAFAAIAVALILGTRGQLGLRPASNPGTHRSSPAA